jgi:hypothetical protein
MANLIRKIDRSVAGPTPKVENSMTTRKTRASPERASSSSPKEHCASDDLTGSKVTHAHSVRQNQVFLKCRAVFFFDWNIHVMAKLPIETI